MWPISERKVDIISVPRFRIALCKLRSSSYNLGISVTIVVLFQICFNLGAGVLPYETDSWVDVLSRNKYLCLRIIPKSENLGDVTTLSSEMVKTTTSRVYS